MVLLTTANISTATGQTMHIPQLILGNTTKMIIDPNKIANIDSKLHLGQKWLLWSNDNAINKYDKLAERAQLYGNLTDVYHNQLLSEQDTLICVDSLLNNETYHDLCDMAITNAIAGDHLAGKTTGNITLGLMQLSYLKVRGLL